MMGMRNYLCTSVSGLLCVMILLQTTACTKYETIIIDPERIRAEYAKNYPGTDKLDHWDDFQAQEKLIQYADEFLRNGPTELLIIEVVANNINTHYGAWFVVLDQTDAHMIMCWTEDCPTMRLIWKKGSIDRDEWEDFRSNRKVKLDDLENTHLAGDDCSSWYICELKPDYLCARTGYAFDLHEDESSLVVVEPDNPLRDYLRPIAEFVQANVTPWYECKYDLMEREWIRSN